MAQLIGTQWTYDSSKWQSQQFYLEAYFKSTDGTSVSIELFGDGQGSVPGSLVSTTSTSFVRVRSSAMTLSSGNNYRARNVVDGRTVIASVKIIVI